MSRTWSDVLLPVPPEGGLRGFHHWQAGCWSRLASSLGQLPEVRVRSLDLADRGAAVQFNPGRVTSTTARVDEAHVAKRPCFLCPPNLPPEERGLPWGENLVILCNPFPVGPLHVVVAHRAHVAQALVPALEDVAALALAEPDLAFFYNGPTSGASAPDHLHWQGMEASALPDVAHARLRPLHRVLMDRADVAVSLDFRLRSTVMARGRPPAVLAVLRETMEAASRVQERIGEPPLNALLTRHGDDLIGLVYLRGAHRPSCYHSTGPDQVLLSPGAVDMAGLMISVRPADFARLTEALASDILAQVSLPGPVAAALLAELQRRFHG